MEMNRLWRPKFDGQNKYTYLLLHILIWFEEDLISLYNEYKIEAKSVSDKNKKSNPMRQNYHNLKKTVRAILLFCNKMPYMKLKNPFEFFFLSETDFASILYSLYREINLFLIRIKNQIQWDKIITT